MSFSKISLLTIILLFVQFSLFAQTDGQDRSVQITATVQSSPAQIQLNWTLSVSATTFHIKRKLKSETSWTTYASTGGSVFSYTDTNVSVGEAYEYRINSGSSYGYIYAGIEVPITESRGHLALVYEASLIDDLETEFQQLKLDMIGDGWQVTEIPIASNYSHQAVKEKIATVNSIQEITAIYLLGDIPVAYSGNIVPDGHTNDHYGAWPADTYYSTPTTTWTDTSVNNTSAPPRTENVPGDGKFDQSTVPNSASKQIGRVDLADLPAFADSELELLRSYLNKAHAFKTGELTAIHQGVIDDNFVGFLEAFAANGYRNFGPLVGTDNIEAGDYFTSLDTESYLWSYGCGGGTYTSAWGIGDTQDFADSAPQGIFTMTFGSYFGDWDTSDNFLRAPLASGDILTNCWAGRPNWFFHHMGLGENIGYSQAVTVNGGAFNTYDNQYTLGKNGVHMALMGDPTLRMQAVLPAKILNLTCDGTDVQIIWDMSADNDVLGYHVYHANSLTGEYTRLSPTLVTGNSFSASCPSSGFAAPDDHYMVRAVKLETTPSGSFYNMSIGEPAALGSVVLPVELIGFKAKANRKTVHLEWETAYESNLSAFVVERSTDSRNWTDIHTQSSTGESEQIQTYITEDENPYLNNNYYRLRIEEEDGSHSYSSVEKVNFTGENGNNISVSPNPTSGELSVIFTDEMKIETIEIYNTLGKRMKIFTLDVSASTRSLMLNLGDMPRGIYLLKVNTRVGENMQRVILE